MGIPLFTLVLALAAFPAPPLTEKYPAASGSVSSAETTSQVAKVMNAPNAQPPPMNKLDTAFIHNIYLDGDFDLAIEIIEDALRYGGPFNHAESVFVYKHLGVMHTATYETREKGKGYMYKLLEVEPTAKILDMYASDMIYMIFKNIQDEFHAHRPLDPAPRKRGPAADSTGSSKQPRYAWMWWTAGAVAAVGGGVLAIHFLEEEKAQARKGNSIDE